MANFFDQFDQPEQEDTGNFFDKFDPPKPKVEEAEPDTFVNRMKESMTNVARLNPLAASAMALNDTLVGDMGKSGAERLAMGSADLLVGTADLAGRGVKGIATGVDKLTGSSMAEHVVPLKDQEWFQDSYARGRKQIQDWVASSLTEDTQAEQQAVASVMEGTDGNWMQKIGAGVGAAFENPRALAVILAQSGGDMAMGLGAARLVSQAATAAGKTAIVAASRGTAAAIGSEALQASNFSVDQAGQYIDSLSDEKLLESPEIAARAKEVGIDQARGEARSNAMSIAGAISGVATLVGGKLSGAGAMMARVANRGTAAAVREGSEGIISSFLKGGLREGGEELFQESGDALAQNIAAIGSGADPTRAWDKGVLEQGAMGMVAGGVMGGPMGVLARPQTKLDTDSTNGVSQEGDAEWADIAASLDQMDVDGEILFQTANGENLGDAKEARARWQAATPAERLAWRKELNRTGQPPAPSVEVAPAKDPDMGPEARAEERLKWAEDALTGNYTTEQKVMAASIAAQAGRLDIAQALSKKASEAASIARAKLDEVQARVTRTVDGGRLPNMTGQKLLDNMSARLETLEDEAQQLTAIAPPDSYPLATIPRGERMGRGTIEGGGNPIPMGSVAPALPAPTPAAPIPDGATRTGNIARPETQTGAIPAGSVAPGDFEQQRALAAADERAATPPVQQTPNVYDLDGGRLQVAGDKRLLALQLNGLGGVYNVSRGAMIIPAANAAAARQRLKEGPRPFSGAQPEAGKEMVRFPKAAEDLGIPRSQMPQVAAQHRGALVNFLLGKGITHEQETAVDPNSLRPVQNEYSPAKVAAARDYEGGDRAVIVSSDNRIMDGTHQTLAALEQGKPIRVIRFNKTAAELLPIIKEFPSATTEGGPKRVKPGSVATGGNPAGAVAGGDNQNAGGTTGAKPGVAVPGSTGGSEGSTVEGGAAAGTESKPDGPLTDRSKLSRPQRIRDVVRRNSKNQKVRDGNVTVKVVEAPGWMKPVTDSIQKVFGREVVFFEASDRTAPNGFADPSDAKTLYVNARSDMPHMFIAMHELLHSIKNTNPAAYKKLVAATKAMILADANSKWREHFEVKAGVMSDESVVEEILADALGDYGSTQEFWDRLSDHMEPSTLRQIAKIMAQALQRILAALKLQENLGSEQWFTEMTGVHDALVEFAAGGVETETESDGDEVMLARKAGGAEEGERSYRLDIDQATRVTKASGSISAQERAALEKDAAKAGLSKEQVENIIETARDIKKNFPASDGWAQLEMVGVKIGKKNSKGVSKLEPKWEVIPYEFHLPPGAARSPSVMSEKHAKAVAEKFAALVTDVYDRAERGDKNAQTIISHQTWYRNVTEILRREYGAAGDLLSDLLGATSPNTPVSTNWKFSVDILRRFMAGDFDALLKNFVEYLDSGKPMKKFPDADKIRQITGKLYGMNSVNAMKALSDMWRSIESGSAPKARNFALNLIGQSNMATIDVWAARMLRRAANNVRGISLPRIPPPAESGVSGNWNKKVTAVTGEFGFGARVMELVSEKLQKEGRDVTPPDLQAIAWFAEKELWARNKWTTKEGEGGSFEEQIEKNPVERYIAGWTTQQGQRTPSTDEASIAQARVLGMLIGDESVVAARVVPTAGLYGGQVSMAYDTEWTAKRAAHDPTMAIAEIAKLAQENDQVEIFVSRVLRPDEDSKNARPGIEVYFKNQRSLDQAMPVLDALVASGQSGFTMAVDPRSANPDRYIGVRLQFIPEIAMRSDAALRERLMDDAQREAVMQEKAGQMDDAVGAVRSMDGVAYAATVSYNTVVLGKEDYDGIIDRAVAGADRAAGGKAWLERPLREGLERAASRHEGERGQEHGGRVPSAGGSVSLSRRRSRRAGGRPLQAGQVQGAERGSGQAAQRLTPLPGAPNVTGVHGPISHVVDVAEKYARDNGIDLKRQSEFVEVDEDLAKRISDAYEEMPHAPNDPVVKAAYRDLIDQTVAQYRALEEAGYKFWFIDTSTPVGQEYSSSPFNALRSLSKSKTMGVFPTDEGFGTGDDAVGEGNPMNETETDVRWPKGGLDGPLQRVLANDLFRAVHDVFGHGMEGAGFRGRGEENAWQAHARLFTGAAVGAITSETRGQNSWLNFGPSGETNRTAKTEDTIFAKQKTGLMPEWTWTEGRAGDMEADDGVRLARAFHGTPHVFDQFSLDYMGTGEGAQAFGWGMYFAENQNVATGYRDKLSGADPTKFILDGQRVGYMGDAKREFMRVAKARGASTESAALAAQKLGEFQGDLTAASGDLGWADVESPVQTEAANLLRALDPISTGSLYEVDVDDAAVAKFLDWDKSLSRQPDSVQEALDDVMRKHMEPADILRFERDHETATGAEFYKVLSASDPEVRADQWASAWARKNGGGNDKAASLILKANGIPGLRFLDGNSRNKPLREVKKEFLAELPEDAEVEEVRELIGTGKFSPKNDAILRALDADGLLGFDYFSQALSAALRPNGLADFDASPELRAAVAAAQEGGTRNLVVFDDKIVKITKRDGSPVTKTQRAEVLENATPGDDGVRLSRSASGRRPDRVAKSTPNALDESDAVKKGYEIFERSLLDGFNRLDRANKVTTARGGTVEDAHKAETLMHGRAQERGKQFIREKVDPIIEELRMARLTLKQAADYLYALHVPERNKAIADKRPGFLSGSGHTNKWAADTIANFTPAQRRVLDNVSRKVQAIHREKLDTLLAGGLISQFEYNALRTSYQHYVPLKTLEEDTVAGPNGRGFDTRGREYKEAFGRGDPASNPLYATFMDANRAIIRAEINEVAQTLLRDVRANPNPELWMEVTSADFTTPAGTDVFDVKDANGVLQGTWSTQRAADIASRSMPGSTVTQRRTVNDVIDTGFRNDPNIVIVKEGGQEKYIWFHDERLAEQIKKIGDVRLYTGNNEIMGKIVGGVSGITRLMSSTMTRYNPAFAAPNFVRDITTAVLNAQNQAGYNGVKLGKDIAAGVMPAMTFILGGEFGNRAAQASRWGQLYKQFKMDGGATGAYGLKDFNETGKELERAMRQLSTLEKPSDYLKFVGDKGAFVLDQFDKVNTSFEDATRLATYAAALNQGKTRREAALLAKNLTVNFNKKGAISPALNALYVFFNAAVQSNVALAKAVGKSPKMWGIVASIVAIGFMQAWDDEDELKDEETGLPMSEYASDAVRDKNFIINRDDGKFVKIPLPYGWNVPWVMGRRLARVARGRNSPGEAAAEIIGSFTDSFVPIKADQPLPTFVQAYANAAMNRSPFEDKPVYKTDPYKQKPEAYQYWDSVNPAYVAFAQFLNKAGGGNENKKPSASWLDVNPGKVENIAKSYLGGPLQTVHFLMSFAQSDLDANGRPKEKDANQRFIINRFLGDRPARFTEQQYSKIEREMAPLEDIMKAGEELSPPEYTKLINFLSYAKSVRSLKAAVSKQKKGGSYEGDLDPIIREQQSAAVKLYNETER